MSQGQDTDKTHLTLRLTACRDVDIDRLGRNPPTLWNAGGMLIDKSAAILGNLNVNGLLTANICSDLIFVDTLAEKYAMAGIEVFGDIRMQPESVLSGDNLLMSNVVADVIVGNVVTARDIFTTTLTAVEKVTTANICVNDTVFANTVVGAGNMLICTIGDIEIKPQGGNLILHNAAMAFDVMENVIGNVLRITTAQGSDLDIINQLGTKVNMVGGEGLCIEGNLTLTDLAGGGYTPAFINNDGSIERGNTGPIVISGNLDMNCNDIGNVRTLELETLTGKNGDEVVITANINMNCNEIGNVEILRVNNIYGKNSPFFVNDTFTMTDSGGDSGQIRFEAGIEIGNAITVAFSETDIAMGKNSESGGSGYSYGAVAIGQNARATGAGCVAIGGEGQYAYYGTEATRFWSVAIGTDARAMSQTTVVIGHNSYTTLNASFSVVIGDGSNSSAASTVTLGRTAQTSDANCIAIGTGSLSSVGSGVAVGPGAQATGRNSIAFGATNDATNTHSIAIGSSAQSTGLASIAIGGDDSDVYAANATANYAIAVGRNSLASVVSGVAIGRDATVAGTSGIAIGLNARSNFASAVALGASANALGANHVQLGQDLNSGTNAQLRFRTQQVSSESWIGGNVTLAQINTNGDIERAGELDLFAADTITANILCVSGNAKLGQLELTDVAVQAGAVTLTNYIEITVNGGTWKIPIGM